MRWVNALLWTVVLIAGCVAVRLPDHLGEEKRIGQETVCLPCYSEGDMGCVRVRVDEKTPQAVYRNGTYYFCSERCREKFQKEPERYLPEKSRKP